MPLKPQELGDRLHVDLRAGITGIDKWRGVNREGDPACPADNQLRYAQNVRLTGGKIVSRGGQAAVNTVATTGCIDGFFDAGDMGAQNPGAYVGPPARGFYMGANVGTFNGSVAETISSYDTDTDSFVTVTNTAAGHIKAWAMLGDAMYVAVGPNEDVDISYDTDPPLTIRAASSLTLAAATFSDVDTYGAIQGESSGPISMCEFDGDLYIAFWDTSVFPNVYHILKFDGTDITSDYSWASNESATPKLGPFGCRNFTAENSLVVVTERLDAVTFQGDMSFLVRNQAGAWNEYSTSSLTGSGGQTDLSDNRLLYIYSDGTAFPIEFDDKMFFGSKFMTGTGTPLAAMIYFSGGTFTLDEELSGYEHQGVAGVFNNNLYFVVKRTSDNHYLLSKRNTAGTYTMAEFDFGTTATDRAVGLFSTATNLYYVTLRTTGNVVKVFKSNGTTTSSFSEADTLATAAGVDRVTTGIRVT